MINEETRQGRDDRTTQKQNNSGGGGDELEGPQARGSRAWDPIFVVGQSVLESLVGLLREFIEEDRRRRIVGK